MEINDTEEIHETPRGGNLKEDACDETGPNRTTHQKESRGWCYSTNRTTDHQKFSIQDIAIFRPQREESDVKGTTEEDDSVDKRVIMMPEENDIQKLVRPAQSSFDQKSLLQ